jgi:hypothetical protein
VSLHLRVQAVLFDAESHWTSGEVQAVAVFPRVSVCFSVQVDVLECVPCVRV